VETKELVSSNEPKKVFLERVLSGIQFTRHSMEFVVVETKELVSSKVSKHDILTRQTCRQHSCMSVPGKQLERPSAIILFFHANLPYVPFRNLVKIDRASFFSFFFWFGSSVKVKHLFIQELSNI